MSSEYRKTLSIIESVKLDLINSSIADRYVTHKTIYGLDETTFIENQHTYIRHNRPELTRLKDKKGKIIDNLFKEGFISVDEYEKYLISDSCDFTPKIDLK